MNTRAIASRMCRTLLLALPLALPACSTTQTPTLTVASAAVKTVDQDALVLSFTLYGTNASDESLPLREVTYTLQLDGTTVFAGHRAAMVTIPAHGEQTFTLPAPVLHEHLGPAPRGAHSWTLYGTAEYLDEGQLSALLFDTGVRRPTVTFHGNGQLPAIEASAERNATEAAGSNAAK